MRTFKKMISIMLALSTILCCLTFSPVANAAKDYSKEINFVTALGVEGFMSDASAQTITRGGFAIALAQILGMDKDTENPTQCFEDVPDTHEAYAAVSYLVRKRVIHGYGNNTFKPDEIITYNEAIKISLICLGYEAYAEVTGGYYDGYKQTALDTELSFVPENYEELTKGETAYLLYKLMLSNYVDATVSGGAIGYVESEETLLKKIYDADEMTGIVTATKTGALYGKPMPEPNRIGIDYESYTTSLKKINDFLGMQVKYYATEDGEVLYIETDKNVETVSAMYDKILDSTNKKSIVIEGEKRNKTYKISGNALYVYNGMPLLAPTDDDLKPEYGEIKLIDNEDDEIIDVVIIWDYKSYIVKTATNTKITFRENEDDVEGVDFEDTSFEWNLIYGSSYMETNLLDSGNVITYAPSKDGSLLTLFVYAGEIEGAQTGYNKSDNTIMIDGEEYAVMPGVDMSRAQGKSAVFYMDKNNHVAGFECYDDDKYGLLLSFNYDESDEIGYMKILNEAGISKYTILKDNKIKYCIGDETKSSKMLPDALYNLMRDGGKKVKKQLIKYTLTSDGEGIASVTVAKDQSDPTAADHDEIPKTEDEEKSLRFSYNHVTDKTDSKYYRQTISLKEGNYDPLPKKRLEVNDRKTFVIAVSEDEDKCQFMLFEDWVTGDQMTFGSFKAYNRTMLGYYEYIVIEMDMEVVPELNRDSCRAFAITGVVSQWDETKEREIYALKGYSVNDSMSKGYELTLEKDTEDEFYNVDLGAISTSARPSRYPKNTVLWEDIKKGDIILYSVNQMTGRCSAFAIIARPEDMTKDYANNDYNTAVSKTIINGKVVAISDLGVRLKAGGSEGIVNVNSADGDEAMLFRGYGGNKGSGLGSNLMGCVLKYSVNRKTYELASWEDISVGDRLLAYRNGTYQHDRGFYVIVE